MYMFIWKDIPDGLTRNWHSGGGAAVIAATHARAKELLAEKAHSLPVEDVPECSASYALEGAEETVYIFPDAGCC